jgi:hypothetical protein
MRRLLLRSGVGSLTLRAALLGLGALLASGLLCAQTPAAGPSASAPPPSSATAQPVNAIWAGEWRRIDSNLPGGASVLRSVRDPASLQVTTAVDGADCPLAYDGLVKAAELVARIDERARWQLLPSNWPPGTDTAQLVGLRHEFEQALRIARSLPPDSYRRVRALCPRPDAGDRFFVLNEGRRLFEFRFPDNDLSLRVTLYERVR